MATELDMLAGNRVARTVPRPRCPACRDTGFILPELEYPYRWTGDLGDALEWDGKGDTIPAGVLYREGIPCVCESGDQFRCEQAEWNQPMVAKPAPQPQRSASEPHKDCRPLMVEDLDAALFGQRPKRTPPPIIRRITAADFERLKDGTR